MARNTGDTLGEVLEAKHDEGYRPGRKARGIINGFQPEAELRDAKGWQTFPLPDLDLAKLEPGANERAAFVVVEALSVYPGAKWKDLCINEVLGPR